MKRFLLFLFLLPGLQGILAQTPPEPTKEKFVPPAIVSTNFSTAYPNVDAVWSSQDDNETYAAEYRVEDTNMGRIVRYDRNGNLLSVDNELHNDAYPIAIGNYYVKKYPHEKYAVWSREDAAGNKTYYANRGEEKVWFDRNGKFMPARAGKSKGSLAKE